MKRYVPGKGWYPRQRVNTTPMQLTTLHLPKLYIKALDSLVKQKLYPNRAEAIRNAIRDLIALHTRGEP